MRFILLKFSVFILIITLAACGFKLRGNYKLPVVMDVTYVQATNNNSELVKNLKRALKNTGVQLSEDLADDVTVLKIIKESSGRRVLSVDNRGKAQEYEIYHKVIFSVANQVKGFSIPEQLLELTRDYIFDSNDVLSANEEGKLLKQDMQNELVRLIMQRLVAKNNEK